MTRFARAKGSKASNERRPEDATSWQDMRKQLEVNQLENKSKTSEGPVEVKPSWKHKIANDSIHEQNENSVWTTFNVSDQKSTKKRKLKSKISLESSKYKKDTEELTTENKSMLKKRVGFKNKIKNSINEDDKLLTENENKVKDHKNVKKKKKHLKSIEIGNLSQHLPENKIKDPEALKSKKKKRVKSIETGIMSQAHKLNAINKEHLDLKVEKESCDNKSSNVMKKKEITNKKHLKKNRSSENNYEIFGKSKEMPNSEEQSNSITIGKDNHFPQSGKSTNPKIANTKSKPVDNSDHVYKRRKPNPGNYTININGKTVDIVCYEGFFIKKEDAENLRKLKKKFIKKGVPRNELQAIMKLERRKAEKALAREKKKVCFHCRKSGHNLSECPELQGNASSATGICFKCGSTEHTYFECKVSHKEEFRFAQCFICKEEGHIAKQCPDNPRGLYPKGGACRACGDVTHMKKDCPELKQTTQQTDVTAKVFNKGISLDVLDEEVLEANKPIRQQNKKIKFF